MRRSLRFALCGTLVVSLSLSFLAEQSIARKKKSFQWDEVSEADWKVSEDTAQGIRDAVIIFEKASQDDQDLKKTYYTVYRRIRILGSEGRSWADVSVPVYFEDQKELSIEGRVILRSGDIVELDEDNVFEKEIFKSKFGKLKQKSFSLTGVTDDCILEYRYVIRMPGHITRWTVQREIASLYAEFSWKFYYGDGASRADFIRWGQNNSPNYMWINTDRVPKVKRLPSLKEPKELVFSIDSVLPLKSEPWSLPAVARQAQLRIYYGSGGSSDAYWGEKASTVRSWQSEFCNKNKRTRELAETFDTLQSEQEKITEAYRWLQANLVNITYDEPEKKPKKHKTSDDALKRGYAYSRQINYIFCDLLQEMNIDARMAFVVDRNDNLFVRDVKEWQFDRGIVAIPTGKNIKYYSPGDKYLPMTHVWWANEGVTALIGLGATGEAARSSNFQGIPFSSSALNKVSRSISANVSGDFRVRAVCQERRMGHPARKVRLYFDDKPISDQPERLRDEISELFPDAKIDSISATARNIVHLPLKLSYNVDFEAPLQVAGKRMFLRPCDFLESTDNPFDAAERETSIMFNYAQETFEALSVSLPEGWEIEALPSDTAVTNKIGTCALSFKKVGGSLSVQRRFVLNSPYWRVEDYAAVQELFAGREALNGLTVVLKKSIK